jgi:hypothetical protein
MTEQSEDAGVIDVLMQRLEKLRLPRALALKEKVDRGERLIDEDIAFLERVFADASRVKPLLDKHPGYESLAVKVIQLYKSITEKALENEQQA